jgi:hypothetical protein
MASEEFHLLAQAGEKAAELRESAVEPVVPTPAGKEKDLAGSTARIVKGVSVRLTISL